MLARADARPLYPSPHPEGSHNKILPPAGDGLEDIVPLFAALQAACKGISMLVQRAAIAGATGVAAGGGENAGGDQQKKLDVVSNDLLKGFLARSGVVRVLASEEVGLRRCVPRVQQWRTKSADVTANESLSAGAEIGGGSVGERG